MKRVHSLDKVEDERLHVAVDYPMHRCANKCDDLQRRPAIKADVDFARIFLRTLSQKMMVMVDMTYL